ncbi:MAG: hypothetical protein ABIH42_11225 [Planctomycetota bacterium]
MYLKLYQYDMTSVKPILTGVLPVFADTAGSHTALPTTAELTGSTPTSLMMKIVM